MAPEGYPYIGPQEGASHGQGLAVLPNVKL
jgi:hypothetical protein